MGLDMYLYAEIYMSKYSEGGEERRSSVSALFPEVNGCAPCTINFEAGYWRKANAIHAWFVEHVQDGEDECNRFYVSRDKLVELKKACKRVLWYPSVAEDILPSASGFFFGSTQYDECYESDLKETIVIIDKALAMTIDVNLYYRSSW